MIAHHEVLSPERTDEAPVSDRAQPEAIAPAGSRLVFLDHLRVALTFLVILHHLAVTYSAAAPWYYLEVPQDTLSYLLPVIFVLFNQGFFMGCFFLISGYFTPGAYDRKGARGFLVDRLLRLGIPLLVFVVLLGPLTATIGYSSIAPLIGAPASPPFWELYWSSIGPGPLWFVEALLILAGGYALWRWLSRGRPAQASRESASPSYRAVIGFTLALTLATFLVRLVMPIGSSLPVLSFPTPAHLAQYIGLFTIGTLAYRRNWFLSLPDRMGTVGFASAFVASVVLFPVSFFLGASPETGSSLFVGGLHWQAFVYALWECIFCVGMCLGLITFFRKRLNRPSALGQFLATHAYTVYIIHALVIVALAYGLRGLLLYPLLKFALASVIAIPLCFAVAYLVRKLPLARRIL